MRNRNIKPWMVGWLFAGLVWLAFRYFTNPNYREWTMVVLALAIAVLPPLIGYGYYRFKNGWTKRKSEGG